MSMLWLLMFSSSSRASRGRSSFAGSSLLIGFAGLRTSSPAGLLDHVTNMAASAGWRRLLRRYVDARFRSHAADKIFDVVAHNYDRWDRKSGAPAFLRPADAAAEVDHGVKGQEVTGVDDDVSADAGDFRVAGELVADSQIAAPTVRMAKYHATCSPPGETYLYYFNDTGSGRRGAAHDLLTYVFGAPLSPGIDPFHTGPYTDDDRRLSVDVITRWSNFINTGQAPTFT